ncbi:MAG: glycosyltransferase family 39 protein [Spirochaetia bacterium]|nr:glycosyltransferase family 39 protein [Spirochaetia bacterium]
MIFKGDSLFFLFLFVGIILRLFYALTIELHPDEAYYWMWSRFPALSYYDQGPGVSYYILLFTSIFGNSLFALKLAAVMPSFFVCILLFLISKELNFTKFFSYFAGLLGFFIPAFFGGSLLIMHDTPLMLMWISALYAAVRFINSRKWIWLYILFIALGFGGLSKYTMIFFAVSLAVWFILTRNFYYILRSFHFYLSILIAGLIVLPVFFWNFQNHWGGFDAVVHLRSSGGSMGGKGSPGLFLAGQIISFSPILFIIILGAIGSFLLFSMLNGFSRIRDLTIFQKAKNLLPFQFVFQAFQKDPAFALIVINALILPLFFMVISPLRIIQANWVYPSYPALIILLVYVFQETKSKFFNYAFYAGFAAAVLFNFYTVFSIEMSNLYTNISGQNIPTGYIPGYKTAGYKQVVDELENLRNEIDPGAEYAANRYQDASIASFYLSDQIYVPSMNVMQKNQYSYWPNLKKGKNYIVFSIQESSKRTMLNLMEPTLYLMFEEVTVYPEKKVILDGRVVKTYQAWHARNFKKGWDEPLVEYLMNRAILDLMPNLDPDSMLKQKKPGQLKEIFKQFMFMNMMNQSSQ